MGRLDTSKAGELRVIAEKLRRRAAEMTLPNYVDLMRRAADDLDAEAHMLERPEPPQPGRHLNIII
jgi:hypothetical protein